MPALPVPRLSLASIVCYGWFVAYLVSGGACTAVAAEPPPAPRKPPALMAVSSLLVPGLGQMIDGSYAEGGVHLGAAALSWYGIYYYSDQDDYLNTDDRIDEDNNREFINRTTLKYDYAARFATNLAFYSAYDVYRDIRVRDNRGYWTPAPRESLTDLAVAPFSWQYLARPTTFIPIAAYAALLFAVDSGGEESWHIVWADDVSAADLHLFNALGNEMTAVGEEAFFRGFLNNELSSRLGRGWGLTLSSVIFGLAHSGTGNQATPLAAGLAGAYLGWLQQRNNFDIGEGVALHFWTNFLVGIAAIENGGRGELMRIQIRF